jgi:hypothetical protein
LPKNIEGNPMSQTHSFNAATIGLILGLCLTKTAGAEPLYLGEEEYSTDDRSVMAAIIEHCVGLQADAEKAEATRVFGVERDEEDRRETDIGPASFSVEKLGISVDQLASGDEDGEAPDFSQVTAEQCSAAGIIY